MNLKDAKEALKKEEIEQLNRLLNQIQVMINQDKALAAYKNQIKLDITSEGLRVQIIDKDNKPMFQNGSDELDTHVKPLLQRLANQLNSLPNKITIIGHTDGQNTMQVIPIIAIGNCQPIGQMPREENCSKAAFEKEKIFRVTGYADSLLYDPKNPADPSNRRVSIIVMKKDLTQNIIDDNNQ